MDIFYPAEALADLVSFGWLGFGKDSYLGNAIHFFIYDTIKIGILLVLVNYIMAVTRYYFPLEKARDILSKKRWFGMNYLMAAVLGIVTPFCSCSSIPLFIGFLSAGIPLGVTFAFLISSPLINESSLYLFPAMFGMKVTILYNVFGLAVAVVGGALVERLNSEKYIIPELLRFKSRGQVQAQYEGAEVPFRDLVKYFRDDGMAITKQIFPYVVLGVGIGAFIHGFVPQSLVDRFLSGGTWWTIPAAVLLGAPLYASSISVLPIMEAMAGKGVPLGTVLAFMTSIVTISLPEALILKKVMRWQLLAIFFGITLVGIVIMGYLFNAIL